MSLRLSDVLEILENNIDSNLIDMMEHLQI